MGKYNITRSELWVDGEVLSLCPAGKLLYVYLLSGPLSNIAGYYRLPLAQIKNDLCRYNKETDEFNEDDVKVYRNEIIRELKSQTKLWKYDAKTEQVLVPTYLKYNKVGGERQIKGIVNALATLSASPLHIDFLYNFLKFVGDESYTLLDKGFVNTTLKMAQTKQSEAAAYITTIVRAIDL